MDQRRMKKQGTQKDIKGKSSLKTAHNKLDTQQQQQQQQRKGLRVITIKKRSARVCVCFL